MARVGRDRDRDLAGVGRPRPRRGEVVLDVAGAAFLRDDDSVDRPLAFELAQQRLVGAPDRMREHIQAAAMGHSDHDLVRAGLGGEIDRLVEHRNHHVQPFERELLLTEERAAEVLLEALGAGDALEQPELLLTAHRLAVAIGLDRVAQPDALGVVRDVLDLVRDRAAVDVAKRRQRLPKRLAGDVHAKQARRDASLKLRGQGRSEPGLVECGLAQRLRSERVESRRQVAVRPMRLDERHRGRDRAEQRLVDLGGRGRGHRRRGWLDRLGNSRRGGLGAAASSAGAPLPPSVSRRRSRPGWVATSSLPPLSNSSRHSAGTASGFSRYSSSTSRA